MCECEEGMLLTLIGLLVSNIHDSLHGVAARLEHCRLMIGSCKLLFTILLSQEILKSCEIFKKNEPEAIED